MRENYEYRNMDEARGCAVRNMGEQKGKEIRGKKRKAFWLEILNYTIACVGIVGAMFFSHREGYYHGVDVMTNGCLDDAIREDAASGNNTIPEE